MKYILTIFIVVLSISGQALDFPVKSQYTSAVISKLYDTYTGYVGSSATGLSMEEIVNFAIDIDDDYLLAKTYEFGGFGSRMIIYEHIMKRAHDDRMSFILGVLYVPGIHEYPYPYINTEMKTGHQVMMINMWSHVRSSMPDTLLSDIHQYSDTHRREILDDLRRRL